MYTFIRESEQVVWRKCWYVLTLGISLWIDLYMTHKDQVFVTDVVVTNMTWETMVSNVICQLACVVAKLSAIAKIHMYRGLDEGHHFILMALEAHDVLGHDMDRFIKECVCFFHDKWLKGHLSLSFCIQFFKQCVNIAFQCASASAIERMV